MQSIWLTPDGSMKKDTTSLLKEINELKLEVDRLKSLKDQHSPNTNDSSSGSHRVYMQRNAIARIAVDETIAFGDRKSSFERLTEIGATALNVQRVSVWLFTPDQKEFHCVSMYDQSNHEHTSGLVIQCSDNPVYFKELKDKSRIYVNDVRSDPRTAMFVENYFDPLDIHSLIDAGIHVNGELVGVLCYEQTGKIREWYPDEESFASTLAAVAAQTLINDERLRTEKALRSSEAQFRLLMEGLPLPVAFLNSNREVTFLNDQFVEIFGFSNNDVATCASWWKKSFPDEDSRNKALEDWNGRMREAKENGQQIIKGEYDVFNNSGKELSIVLSAIHMGENLLVTFEDVTQRRKNEQELIIAKEKAEESDRLKTAFLANMSHEIRTPLNGILGFTSFLKAPDLSMSDRTDYINVIEKSGQRLLNTVNDIVNLSKIEAGQINVDLQETNLNGQTEFIYNFFQPKMAAKGLEFTVSNGLSDGDAFIRTDVEKVYAILTNLVNNALKFTGSGQVSFGYVQKANMLEFFVQDSGPGILEENQQLIFERFRQGNESLQRHFEGSGLGLAISKAYVELLGGKIWLRSSAGQGAEFRFTVPYIPSKKQQVSIPAKLQPNGKVMDRKLKILVAEDDATSMKLMELTLQPYCRELIHAKTGIEVLESLKEHSDIDLVLMDIHMPEMDGYTATRELRNTHKDLLVIAQTSFGMDSDRDKALQAGCNDYISKPIDPKVLDQLILKHAV